ncbi:hypothetical protein I6A60_37595 [Frankia sp. AgB1.9]|uniref:hypothetical protein n=1 Tax=unclassified Frankia TaxID=2632575 RepID=UPI001931A853|nr:MULTISPECIES: hypothetical protein [unclassified Frankia]MBL7493623.1 hypothetical protein [Frankia sp. AgW1.1]MBL7553514.1 hypothetical protein [Frankia sp. AgB1.9]MBL7622370.1 hypothetical protein [Frankia sp. AgB1.8]
MAPSVPRRVQRASTVYFDLADVERELTQAWDSGRSPIGFATRYADPSYLNVLRERIRYVYPNTEIKLELSLSEHLTTPEHGASEIAAYHGELDAVNVLCLVQVDRPPRQGDVPAALQRFWQLVCDGLGGISALQIRPRRRLILLFAVHPEVGLPDGIQHLPDPIFTRYDVWKWAAAVMDELGDHHEWPREFRDSWRDHLCAKAAHTPGSDRLDPRRLYLAMKDSIRLLGADPDAFRRTLEGIVHGEPPHH